MTDALQVARLPEALPPGAAGPRPQPTFYGLSQLPVRHSMYSSTLSQLSMLGASYGPLDPGGMHRLQTSGQIQVNLWHTAEKQGPDCRRSLHPAHAVGFCVQVC